MSRGRPPLERWAEDWSTCQGCRSSEQRHVALGLCHRCYHWARGRATFFTVASAGARVLIVVPPSTGTAHTRRLAVLNRLKIPDCVCLVPLVTKISESRSRIMAAALACREFSDSGGVVWALSGRVVLSAFGVESGRPYFEELETPAGGPILVPFPSLSPSSWWNNFDNEAAAQNFLRSASRRSPRPSTSSTSPGGDGGTR